MHSSGRQGRWRGQSISPLLAALALVACGSETVVQPFDSVNPPAVLRSHVSGEAATLVNRQGHFQLPAPLVTASEIPASRATELAGAYLVTFGVLAKETWAGQRGSPIAVERLRPCGRVTYAQSSYEPLPANRSLWARKLVGNWWLVMLCDGASAQVLIAVSAHNIDVTVSPDGRLVQPPVDGNNFLTRGIPLGESLPISPEAAVIQAATEGGARVSGIPAFVVRPRPAAPWLGAWTIRYERPVTVTGARSGRTSTLSDLAVGYDDSWKVRLLVSDGTGEARTGDSFADYGFPGESPTFFVASFRAGIATGYESVRGGGR